MSQSILAHVIPKVTQAEPAATRALHHLLDASGKVAERFLELVESERFEIGRIGCEWHYAAGVRPDVAIHDARNGRPEDLRREQVPGRADRLPAGRLSQGASRTGHVRAGVHRAGGPDQGRRTVGWN